jgi:hypothetical protein
VTTRLTINGPATLYPPAHAAKIVEALRSNDPDWTYEVVDVGNDLGCVRIDVHDEDGEFLGSWNG